MAISVEKKKALEALKKTINKQLGKGTIETADKHLGIRMVRAKTGILSFDIKSGGGMVLNSINLFYGAKSQGKSTLVLHTIAYMQKQGKVCAYIYTEGVLDENHMISCGVDLSELQLILETNSERCIDAVQTLAMSKSVDYIVVDSGQGLVPKRILATAAQQHVGVEAYFIGQLVKKFNAAVYTTSEENPWCTLSMISQGSEPHGGGLMFPKGGDIQQFFAVQMIEVRAGNGLTSSGTEISEHAKRAGHQIYFKFRKNKTFPPYKAGMINYYVNQTDFGIGRGDIDHVFDTVVCGIQYGIFKQAGAWIRYEDQNHNGKPAFSNWLRTLPEKEYEKIREEIYQKGLQQESAIIDNDDSSLSETVVESEPIDKGL